MILNLAGLLVDSEDPEPELLTTCLLDLCGCQFWSMGSLFSWCDGAAHGDISDLLLVEILRASAGSTTQHDFTRAFQMMLSLSGSLVWLS